MQDDVKKEEAETKTEVVEKRIRPTVIRRRQQKVEAAPPPEAGSAAEVAAAETKGEASPEAEVEAPGKAAKPEAVRGGEKFVEPTEVERKIGVVGHIDLATAKPMRIKEDWRERGRRSRRRKGRAEMEMEAIQRAGGLKQYAGLFTEEEESPKTHSTEDRVFKPTRSGRKRRQVRREFKKPRLTEPRAIKKVIRIEDGITVSDLSQAVGVKASGIIKKLMDLNVIATVNQQLDVDTATLIAEEHGYKIEHTAFKEEDVLIEPEAHASAGNLSARAPVVTIMGHVDHGKTSILDVVRKTNVTAGEAGGITQHIGAYEVSIPKGRITFLDTPGHEAFTAMRARGAQVTDIVVLVVAADDGIMPQTIEAIDHAKAAGVPIIVAINKIDKPQAQPDRVKKGLSEHELMPEDWGGDVICVNTSAKTKEGIDRLLEMILLQAEMLELKADPTIRPKGVVIEARLDKGRGPVATVLIQEGTLRKGSYVVCGMHHGKVRAMYDASGDAIEEAGLAKPVEILGLTGIPSAGDEMVGVADEQAARMVADQRMEKDRRAQLATPVHVSLEDLASQLKEGETKELGVIVKADVHGSVEAVSENLSRLSTDKVKLSVLHTGVGGITENDIMLASASNAVVLGFNVRPDVQAKQVAEREGVDVRCYRVIYEMIDEVRKAMEGLLAPLIKEVSMGTAEVRQVFKISKVGTVAGCQVVSGKIQRNAKVRLLRDQAIVFEGQIASLRRFKEDAREVAEGYECGIGLENFNDVKEGDTIEAYVIEKKRAKL